MYLYLELANGCEQSHTQDPENKVNKKDLQFLPLIMSATQFLRCECRGDNQRERKEVGLLLTPTRRGFHKMGCDSTPHRYSINASFLQQSPKHPRYLAIPELLTNLQGH